MAGRQTRIYREGKLRADRVNALAAVDGWQWSMGPAETLANRQRWEERLAQVAAFVSANGWYPRRTIRNVEKHGWVNGATLSDANTPQGT